jgi:hypothetical protein
MHGYQKMTEHLELSVVCKFQVLRRNYSVDVGNACENAVYKSYKKIVFIICDHMTYFKNLCHKAFTLTS